MRILLLLQVLSTLSMFGLIWFVQVVHYPLFARVGSDFTAYAADHATRTTYVVAPLMVVELATGALLLRPVWRPGAVHADEAVVGAVLIAVIWLATALVQVPLHNTLQTRFDAGKVTRLVRTNWIRTFAWSLRAVLVLMWAGRLAA